MRRAWEIVAILVGAVFVVTLADRFVLVELLGERIGVPVVVALIEAVAIYGTGFLAIALSSRALTLLPLSHGEKAISEQRTLEQVRVRGVRLAQHFIIGYPIFGTICFLVGLVRITAATMLPVLLLLAIAGAYALVREWRRRPAKEREPAQPSAIRDYALIAIGIVFVCGFIAAQAPPASLDELSYHLAIPHEWAVEGRAIELPLISHSYFPLGVESADLPLLSFLGPLGGGIASHFLHLIAAIATAVLAWRASRRNLLVTAAIVTTPALALTAGWSLVDWPLLGSFIVLAAAAEEDDEPATAGAIAAGLLTKYTFIPFAILALIVTRKWRGAIPGAIAGSVFFVRNLVLTGNPIAPFLSANAPHVVAYRDLVLSSYIFDGRFIDESLGASLMSTALFATTWLGIASLVVAVLFFALAPSARLLVPYFGIAATRASEAVERRRVLRLVVVLAIGAQVMLVGYFIDRTELFSTISGKWSDAEYLTKARSSFGDINWLNTVLPADSRTLVVGLNETYWFARPVRGGGNFDGPRISAYLDAATPEALRLRLQRDRITHVAVFAGAPPTGVAQKVAERQTVLTPSAKRSLSALLDTYVANVTARGNVTLFALR